MAAMIMMMQWLYDNDDDVTDCDDIDGDDEDGNDAEDDEDEGSDNKEDDDKGKLPKTPILKTMRFLLP